MSLNFLNVKLPHISTLKLSFSLQGSGSGYRQGGTTIVEELTHRLSRSDKAHEDLYGGGIKIGTSKYTVSAVGAYDKVFRPGKKDPYESLVVFGVMEGFVMNFGHMEVTGIMRGFGYKSHLEPLDVDRVQEFPFFEFAKQKK